MNNICVKNMRGITGAVFAALLLLLPSGLQASPSKAPTLIDMVIVYAGGPDAGAEVNGLIDQLLDYVAGQTNLPRNSLSGAYFNQIQPAIEYCKTHKNAFILGSLGLYLGQKKSWSLIPLAKLHYGPKGEDRYYLVVRKGRYESLDDLKGKELSGNTLYEDHRFLNNVVFKKNLDITTWFSLSPTLRPLSAVKRAASDKMDAVLLNQVQYDSLARLPLAAQMETIFTSDPLPPLGFMMMDSAATRPIQGKVLDAVVKMCESTEGKPICTNFGITGFERMSAGELNAVTKLYDSAN